MKNSQVVISVTDLIGKCFAVARGMSNGITWNYYGMHTSYIMGFLLYRSKFK